jgi:hypothetical protein
MMKNVSRIATQIYDMNGLVGNIGGILSYYVGFSFFDYSA